MTHLRIEQNTNIADTEEVSSSVIEKLYGLVSSGDLDASSNLKGRINADKTYRTYANALMQEYPQLIITANDYAIPFEDQNMLNYLIGLGIGSNGLITEGQASLVTSVANSVNTTITKFNELRHFTNVTSSKNGYAGSTSGNIKFIGWTALEEVDISNFVSIGHSSAYGYEDTFLNCTSLKTVTASNKLKNIGYSAFRGCTNLEYISGLSGVITIDTGAFANDSKLENRTFSNVEIDLHTTSGGSGGAFEGCSLLEELQLSAQCTTIPSNTFKNCTNLATINLSNVTSIESEAFAGCTSLTSANLENVTHIGNNVFYNSLNGATISLARLTTTSYGGLKGCKMSSVTSLGSISSIPESFLIDCPNLTSITLPISCTTLEHDAIKDNPLLTSINVENLVTIGSKNFTFTPGLPEIMHFPNVTTFVSYQDAQGYIGSTGIKYLYLPKLTAGGKGYDSGGSNVAGMFISGGWSDQCHTKYIVYFKDLSSLTTGAFCGTAIRNLVINNITPPTVTANTTVVTNDLLNSTQPRSTITNVYVPDTAVSTYQSTAYWQDMNIVSMNNINKVATRALWDALPDNDKADTLIEEYM